MKAKKLLQVAEMLDGLSTEERKLFGMFYWKKDTECGTACCVLGYSVQKGIIPFKFEKYSHSEVYDILYKGSAGWNGVVDYFGITHKEALKLFGDSNYNTNVRPKTVAKRIRKFVESKQKEKKK